MLPESVSTRQLADQTFSTGRVFSRNRARSRRGSPSSLLGLQGHGSLRLLVFWLRCKEAFSPEGARLCLIVPYNSLSGWTRALHARHLPHHKARFCWSLRSMGHDTQRERSSGGRREVGRLRWRSSLLWSIGTVSRQDLLEPCVPVSTPKTQEGVPREGNVVATRYHDG